VAEDPDHAEYQSDLAQSYNHWGLFLSQCHRLAEAEPALRQSVRILEELRARFPAKADEARILGMGYNNLANLLRDIGKTDEAEAFYRRHADLIARALQQFPGNRDLRYGEWGCALNYGIFLLNKGRIPEAEKSVRTALRLARKFVEDFPASPHYRLDLAGTYGNLAYVLENAGRPDQAEEYRQESRRIAEKLAADFPTVPDYQSYLGGALNNLALQLLHLGKPAAARPLLEKAIEQQQAALRLTPKHRGYRLYLSNHITNLVNVLDRLQVSDEEVDRVRAQAVALARGLAEDYPDVVDYQSGVGAALNNRASALVKRKEWEQACPLLQEAIAFQKKALQSNPKHPVYLEYLANHYSLLAEVLQALKRPEATTAYRDWIGTARELASVSPQSSNWKAVIKALDKAMAFRGGGAADWFLLAMAHWRLGEKEKARQWFDQAAQWMDKNAAHNEELLRFRAEAEQLLGVKTKK
jgi:tetratricopeptide (TPR) repeat protein